MTNPDAACKRHKPQVKSATQKWLLAQQHKLFFFSQAIFFFPPLVEQ
jgi:hypothetical protein